ncbi:MAG: hypothetical protein GKR96_02360 [Gammaproteobacteria bacterium]|nr:hypothetical protein [Gammaproteobacteria bacterium]
MPNSNDSDHGFNTRMMMTSVVLETQREKNSSQRYINSAIYFPKHCTEHVLGIIEPDIAEMGIE